MYGGRRDAAAGGGSGQVCQFFLQGRCKFGDSCKNEHPGETSQQTTNRFDALQGTGGRGRAGAVGGTGDRYRPSDNRPLPYHLNAGTIKLDLTRGGDGERPSWPLSAYGPGRDAPRQLLEGVVEQSPEELRVQYYLAKASGSTQQYEQTELAAVAHADKQIESILVDIEGAVKYVVDGKDVHPNRLDGEKKTTEPFRSGQSGTSAFAPPSTFGAASNTPRAISSSFGQPSAFGVLKPSPFGQSSSLGQGSAFGQPSTLRAASAFSKPDPLAGAGSTFGQPSTSGTTVSAFGQSSALGAKPSVFGQPSQPTFGQSSFGQASKPAFGAPSQPSSTFGQPSGLGGTQQQQRPFANLNGTSGLSAAANQPSAFQNAGQGQSQSSFGQPSVFGSTAQASTSPFAPKPSITPAFGQPSQPSTSTFGLPAQPSASVFGRPSQPGTSTSGQPLQGASSVFGQPSRPNNTTFGQPSEPSSSTFGQPSSTSGANVFGGSAVSNGTPAAARPNFGAQSTALASPQPTQPTHGTVIADGGPALSTYVTRNPDGSLRTFKGRMVRYDGEQNPTYQNPSTGRPERIWMPDGPPSVPNPDVEGRPEMYVGELGAALREVYDYVREKGQFKDGLMPEIPPKREWVRWDL